MKKNPALTEATRRALRSAFWSLYQEKPLDQITVKQITDLAGYNRSTFYQYYQDIYDVLEQIESQVLQSMESFAGFVIQHAQEMSLAEVISAFLERQAGEEHYLKGLLGEHGDRDFERRLVQWSKSFFGSLSCWQEIDPVARDWLLEYHISGMIGVMKRIIRQGLELTAEQIIRTLSVISGKPADQLARTPFASLMKWQKQLKTVDKPGIIEKNSIQLTGGQTHD